MKRFFQWLISPLVIAGVIAWVVLGEILAPVQIIGGAVVLLGIFIGLQIIDALAMRNRLHKRSVNIGPAITLVVVMLGFELYGIGGSVAGLAIAVFAVFRAGGIACPINTRLNAREIADFAALTTPRWCITDVPEIVADLKLDGCWTVDAMPRNLAALPDQASLDPNADAEILGGKLPFDGETAEALVFQHFPSKAALYEEILRLGCEGDPGLERLAQLTPSTASLVEMVQLLIQHVALGACAEPHEKEVEERLALHSLVEDGEYVRLVSAWVVVEILPKFALCHAAAAAAGDLSAYVRRRLDEARERTIEFADRAALAGETCELEYDSLKKKPPK